MLKETRNGYIHVEIPKEETEREKLLQMPYQAYKAIVILDSSGEYNKNDIIYVTKSGLMPIAQGSIIHKDRVLGVIKGAE